MTSFKLPIEPRQRKASRFLGRVYSELQRALVEEKTLRKLTQQDLASQLGVNRSVVNRQFSGHANLTLRSIADLAWVLNREIVFELQPTLLPGQNRPLLSVDDIARRTETMASAKVTVTKSPATMRSSTDLETVNG